MSERLSSKILGRASLKKPEPAVQAEPVAVKAAPTKRARRRDTTTLFHKSLFSDPSKRHRLCRTKTMSLLKTILTSKMDEIIHYLREHTDATTLTHVHVLDAIYNCMPTEHAVDIITDMQNHPSYKAIVAPRPRKTKTKAVDA